MEKNDNDQAVDRLLYTLYILAGEVYALNRQVSCETNPPQMRQAAENTIGLCRYLQERARKLFWSWENLTAEQRNEQAMALREMAARIFAEL